MTAKVIFDLDPDKGGRKEFATIAEAMVWVREQADAWRNLVARHNYSGSPNFAQLQARLENVGEELKHRMKPPRLTPDEPIIFNDRDIIITESLVGRIVATIARLIGVTPAGAALAAAGVSEEGINWTHEPSVAGVVMLRHYLAEARELRYGSETKHAATALFALQEDVKRAQVEIDGVSQLAQALAEQAKKNSEALTAKIATDQSLLSVAIETSKKDATERFELAAKELDAVRQGYSSAFADAGQALDAMRREQSDSLDAWQATQRERLKLQPPARLWSDREADHQRRKKTAAIIAAVVGTAGFIASGAVAWGAFEFAGWLLSGAEINSFAGVGGEVERQLRQQAAVRLARSTGLAPALRPTFHAELIFAAAATLLWLTMYVWAMRVLVKIYTTEHHLAINASGRSAMVETYLGLMSSEAADVGDRPIVLGAIFQPISDGFVNDDGPPQMSIPAIVATLVAGKTGGAPGAN